MGISRAGGKKKKKVMAGGRKTGKETKEPLLGPVGNVTKGGAKP